LEAASKKAKTQHERLTALLEKRGGSPSDAKTALAGMLAFTPLNAQIGHDAAEKNTQHLIVTFAAAAAEMAMYQGLISAAQEAGDEEVLSLARQLQSEEQDDYRQVWSILPESARASFQREIDMGKDPDKVIIRYLEDTIAAEKSFETQLEAFGRGENDTKARNLFLTHARETRSQYERLTERLHQLGGSQSMMKSIMAHVFAFAPKMAQVGHDPAERLTQNLMMAYSVENAEIAIYQALAEACRVAGDEQTEEVAISIQQQEKDTADKIWSRLDPTAKRSLAA